MVFGDIAHTACYVCCPLVVNSQAHGKLHLDVSYILQMLFLIPATILYSLFLKYAVLLTGL
jgi:hypothetical protein